MECHVASSMRQRIQDWLYSQALPVWSEAGRDREAGGFFDCLTFAGDPVADIPKRLRVQVRQVYVYSHASLLGWDGPALSTARAGYDFVVNHYWHPDGGWVFAVDRGGRAVNQVRETYEQAFALFGFAWLYRATRDASILPWVERTIRFLDARLWDQQHGGYRDSIPDKPLRRQNPHMHLQEAFLALYESTEEMQYLQRAKRLTEMVGTIFQDSSSGALIERFTETWVRVPDRDGMHVEPGHHFEWVWLLHWYAKCSGDRSILHTADRLYRFGVQHGLDNDGLAFDGIWNDGTVRIDTKRLWPQTEALRAHLIEENIHPTPEAVQVTDALVSTVHEKYLRGGNGLWQDHIQRDGTGVATNVPASTFYHVFQAFTEYLQRRSV